MAAECPRLGFWKANLAMRSHFLAMIAPLVFFGAARVASSADAKGSVEYLSQIKPLLATKCFACHGALRQEAGLRLDASSLIAQGSDSGPVVRPGRSGDSKLMARVLATDALRMPPEGDGERLTTEQLALLRRWIDQGAVAPEEPIPPDPRAHWAYRPPVSPEVPRLNQTGWIKNPIDSFLAKQHAAAGLLPAAPAARETLLRRVYFDLIGLPPTRAELQAFLQDDSPQAYERVVDRLLESPQYGERWGRHWMDVWRYSDWSGFGNEIRYSQPHIWRWRDWIIESLNEDRGYDQMILEMLAADELTPNDPRAARATGFLVRNWYKFDRNTWLDDTVEHTAKAFLGMTINCCRCHDHKYDPLTQREYYQLRAVFEPYDVRTEAMLDARSPGAELARAYDARPETATYLFIRGDAKRPDAEHPIAPGVPAVLGGELTVESIALPLASYYPAIRQEALSQRLAEAAGAVSAAEQVLAKLREPSIIAPAENDGNEPPVAAPPTDGAIELAESHLKTAQAKLAALRAIILAEAKKHDAMDLLPEGVEAELNLSPEAASAAAAKADRAATLASAEESLLTARIELAQAHRARKLDNVPSEQAIKTAEQKFTAAEKAWETARQAVEKESNSYPPLGPSYSQRSTGRRLALARWITDRANPLTARVAVNHVWQRHFGAPLVENMVDFGLRSSRPQQADLLDFLAVQFVEGQWKFKPLHRLIVTSQAYQMSSSVQAAPAEVLQLDRDNQLLWRMNPRRLEAEAVRDSLFYLAGILNLSMGGPDLDHSQGLAFPRRSVYFRHAREKQMEFLMMFDAASPIECYRRENSIRPQQAFALMNSALALAQSRNVARRLTEMRPQGQPEEDREYIRRAFETVLSREPSPDEQTACIEFLREQESRLTRPQDLQLIGVGDAGIAAASDPKQRARENLILVLFNHNDFVTVR